ncbi:hypothetical protein B1F79_01050 [Coxiella-like endosymbiont of Rhipicephalus sanguineus]|uniref:hypothetical protein n=1 Tax=Coxiella-like endosymbiont of Rhipicephalus sanguineus TaxID=1955402 RepID=UPI00203A9CBD|nr:hypothetical protein [Coxiella-like endosymbiont of Rhipicephalus sanguineus]MBT8506321.1 hypothetical protein [Coxiella-like endosymbiont of Rhipicephalus sanguineus]
MSWRAIFSRITRWQVDLKFHVNASGIPAFVEPIASNFYQNGYSGSGQVEVRYQFYNPWFLGAEFAAMENSETAHTVASILSPVTGDLIFVLR